MQEGADPASAESENVETAQTLVEEPDDLSKYIDELLESSRVSETRDQFALPAKAHKSCVSVDETASPEVSKKSLFARFVHPT